MGPLPPGTDPSGGHRALRAAAHRHMRRPCRGAATLWRDVSGGGVG